jgi:hypothetical protein
MAVTLWVIAIIAFLHPEGFEVYAPEGKSLMACHRRRGLRIVRGDDSFHNHRRSLAPSLLLPKPDPLSLGSGFVLSLVAREFNRLLQICPRVKGPACCARED